MPSVRRTCLRFRLTSLFVTCLFVVGAAAEAAETTWSIEVKGRYRSSDDARFRVNFPFGPDQFSPGQDGVFLRTVDPSSATEWVSATLELGMEWEHAAFGFKFDSGDLDDRNPTSTAEEYDLDELWFRWGRETDTAIVPERGNSYLKLGKFGPFERQDDRHLESYGLVATAFNRMEDAGLELGVDLGRYVYLKGSYTHGNPIFMRDPNALAGDNGTPAFRLPNPAPEFNSGIVFPYDADLQDVDFENPEVGFGLGFRAADATGNRGAELLVWSRERDLAATVDIDGSFYGGDLDLLLGPGNQFPFPVTSARKQEDGVNLWLYLGGFSLFAQFVDQDLAGLPRTGLEAELAWRFELPPFWSASHQQILPSIAPALRYSRLDPDFAGPAQTPTPSFTWDWEKWDYGLRIGVVGRTDLTIEYSDNSFTLGSGVEVGLDELSVTGRLRLGS